MYIDTLQTKIKDATCFSNRLRKCILNGSDNKHNDDTIEHIASIPDTELSRYSGLGKVCLKEFRRVVEELTPKSNKTLNHDGVKTFGYAEGFQKGANYALKTAKVFCCKTDFDYHLGSTDTLPVEMFNTVESLKKAKSCVKECGILQVEVRIVEVVAYENYADLANSSTECCSVKESTE